jgi:hypothetical protein
LGGRARAPDELAEQPGAEEAQQADHAAERVRGTRRGPGRAVLEQLPEPEQLAALHVRRQRIRDQLPAERHHRRERGMQGGEKLRTRRLSASATLGGQGTAGWQGGRTCRSSGASTAASYAK